MERKVLDRGSIEMVDFWGSDEQVIRAARTSTGKSFQGWGPFCRKCGLKMVVTAQGNSPADYSRGTQKECDHDADKPGDEKLLKYLWDHKHQTPFEMCGMTVAVKAPIMVVREWMRHRTFSYSEASARYAPLPDENYLPSVERVLGTDSGPSRQSQGVAPLNADAARAWLENLSHAYAEAEIAYRVGLEAGVPKEIARLILPVGRFTRMVVSGNLRNWLAFLRLRCASDAQWEIRQYAREIAWIVAEKFPKTWEVARSETMGDNE